MKKFLITLCLTTVALSLLGSDGKDARVSKKRVSPTSSASGSSATAALAAALTSSTAASASRIAAASTASLAPESASSKKNTPPAAESPVQPEDAPSDEADHAPIDEFSKSVQKDLDEAAKQPAMRPKKEDERVKFSALQRVVDSFNYYVLKSHEEYVTDHVKTNTLSTALDTGTDLRHKIERALNELAAKMQTNHQKSYPFRAIALLQTAIQSKHVLNPADLSIMQIQLAQTATDVATAQQLIQQALSQTGSLTKNSPKDKKDEKDA